MLRILEESMARAYSWPVDTSAEFEGGFIAQLTGMNNQIVATVSNGSAPIGIIDDQKTKSFTSNAWDEQIIVPVANPGIGPNNTLVTPVDIKTELVNPNVLPNSFISIPVPVKLIPRNGVVIFPAGTPLNLDMLGTGIPNAIKTNVRYTYQIPNIIGDDSTFSSQRVTIWYHRLIFETNIFETNQIYTVNSNLFVSEFGMLTSREPAPNYPVVALCTAPPSSMTPTLQAIWL